MTGKHQILVNGKAGGSINAADRGIAYGDGVFETMLCVNGTVPLLQRHLTRLEYACKVLGLSEPSHNVWEQDFRTLMDGNSEVDRCVIKFILTRGSGGLGYAPASESEPSRIVQQLDFPAAGSDDDLKGDVLETLLGSNRQLAGIKHLNRLEQVLAAKEVQQRNLHEGLVCNQHGFLIEAVSSNVIVVFGDRVVTPKLDTAGVRGVMRDLLIEATRLTEQPIVKDYVHSDALNQADEIILCNSVRGVRRVGQLGAARLTRRTVFDTLSGIAANAFKGHN